MINTKFVSNALVGALAFFAAAAFAPQAAFAEDLDDLAFLEGRWRGGDNGFVFEEIWSGPGGGVMTGMARGVNNGSLAVLEYIVIEETSAGPVMRFKHFNPDYSNWPGEEGEAITLPLKDLAKKDGEARAALFETAIPGAEVKSVRYALTGDGALIADVILVEDGKEGGFTLNFKKVD